MKTRTRRQVLFIQGGGEGVHDRWDRKLVDSLGRSLGPDYSVQYPRMPDEADPRYLRWKTALMQELARMDEGSILTGHSVGGTVLINALAEERPNWMPSGIFVISAPFVGKGGWPSQDIRPASDLGAKLPTEVPIYFYHGTRDAVVPVEHLDLYQQAVPRAVVRRLAGRDHQLNDDLADVAADIRKQVDGR